MVSGKKEANKERYQMAESLRQVQNKIRELLWELERKIIEQLDPDEELDFTDYKSPVPETYSEIATTLEELASEMRP